MAGAPDNARQDDTPQDDEPWLEPGQDGARVYRWRGQRRTLLLPFVVGMVSVSSVAAPLMRLLDGPWSVLSAVLALVVGAFTGLLGHYFWFERGAMSRAPRAKWIELRADATDYRSRSQHRVLIEQGDTAAEPTEVTAVEVNEPTGEVMLNTPNGRHVVDRLMPRSAVRLGEALGEELGLAPRFQNVSAHVASDGAQPLAIMGMAAAAGALAIVYTLAPESLGEWTGAGLLSLLPWLVWQLAGVAMSWRNARGMPVEYRERTNPASAVEHTVATSPAKVRVAPAASSEPAHTEDEAREAIEFRGRRSRPRRKR